MCSIGFAPHLPCKYTNAFCGSQVSPYILSSIVKICLKKESQFAYFSLLYPIWAYI